MTIPGSVVGSPVTPDELDRLVLSGVAEIMEVLDPSPPRVDGSDRLDVPHARDADPSDASRRASRPPRPLVDLVRAGVRRFDRGPVAIVALGVAVFIIVFTRLHVRNHDAYGSMAFDTGIYDQAIWLLGHTGNPFMTVRGMAVHGHHVNPILFLLAPFTWVGLGTKFFLFVQTAVVGLGAVPVFLIGRSLFAPHGSAGARGLIRRQPVAGAWLAAGIAIAYLLSPVVEWINFTDLHPETFAATPFLFAWWFAMCKRWRPYAVCLLLVLAVREETALAVVMLGVVLMWEARESLWTDAWRNRERRAALMPGLATAAAGIGWYLVATKLILPAFNYGRPPYYLQSFFGSFGGNLSGLVGVALHDPGRLVSTVTKVDRLRYYRDLGVPVLFVFVLSPLHLLLALPTLVSNVLTDNPYPRMIRYQYSAALCGPLWIATLQGLHRLRGNGRGTWARIRVRWLRRAVLGVLLATLIANVNYSPSPLSRVYHSGIWSSRSPHTDVLDHAVAMVPRSAGVSATYNVLPHLDQRRLIYNWPNPFTESYWGNYDAIHPTPLPDPSRVTWLVVDQRAMGDSERKLLASLIAPGGRFAVRMALNDVVVAEATQ